MLFKSWISSTAMRVSLSTIPCQWMPPPEKPATVPTTFIEYAEQLSEWERNLISVCDPQQDEEDICEVLQEEITIFLVSDGGVKNGFGYFG
eukprot:7735646-Ditylum_brightwellii.AAC.1